MIEKDKLQKILDLGMSHGADFVELFFEDKFSRSTVCLSGTLNSINESITYGVGARLLQGENEVYGYTNDISEDSITKLVADLASSFNGEALKSSPLGVAKKYKVLAKVYGNKVNLKKVSKRLLEVNNIIKNYSPFIVQSQVALSEEVQKVLIVNSKGVYQDDLRIRTRIALVSVASNGTEMQQAFEGPGKSIGVELMDKLNLDELALDVAKRSVDALEAEEFVSQVLPVVLNNGFGGVIFHEACGHPLEASAVSRGYSTFAGKVGKEVGSSKVTAYDDASQEGEWGYVNFDDEGNKGERKLLIKDGILQDYMVDYRNGLRMNHRPNGASRRQSYKFSPTSRMSVTYIDNGSDSPEDIIADTEYGLFASKLGGGSVDPTTGEFNFSVQEGYMIEGGKLTKRVKGATLVGHGHEILFKIDKVGNNLSYGQGVCGAASGSVPTDVGQPMIRVSSMTVGGGGKR
jgi:TldD protein